MKSGCRGRPRGLERKALHSAGCSRVCGGLKLTSPLYSTSYTGTAFILLSWHESAELEGGESGEREKNTLTSELVVEHMQLLPLKGKTERRLKADVN